MDILAGRAGCLFDCYAGAWGEGARGGGVVDSVVKDGYKMITFLRDSQATDFEQMCKK